MLLNKLPIQSAISSCIFRNGHIFSRYCKKFNPPLLTKVCLAQNFHTSKQRLLHPFVIVIFRPLSKVFAAILGRRLRIWWKALPINKKALLWKNVRRHKLKYMVFSGFFIGTGYDFINYHIVVSPFTERKRFMILNSEQLKKVSDVEFEENFISVQKFLHPETHYSVYKAKSVCQRLLLSNKEIPELFTKHWKISVVNAPIQNCMVFSNGQIIIYQGMLDLVDNDDQLACILSHEISHVVLEHNAEKLNHAQLIDSLMIIPLTIIWAFLPNIGIAAVTDYYFEKVIKLIAKLPYSRTLESEADKLGLILLASACYDVRQASRFWGRMALLESRREIENDELPIPEYLSTHPSHANRQAALDELMPRAISVREAKQCPKLCPIDPRESVKIMQEFVNNTKKEELVKLRGVI